MNELLGSNTAIEKNELGIHELQYDVFADIFTFLWFQFFPQI